MEGSLHSSNQTQLPSGLRSVEIQQQGKPALHREGGADRGGDRLEGFEQSQCVPFLPPIPSHETSCDPF